jgi:uncharacterized protein (DUF1015 family)
VISPFPAYVVKPDWAGRVVSPMHDVLSQEERAARMATNPYSYLHVARQTGDDGPGVDPGRQAAAALARLLSAGAFAHHPEPALYTYELATSDHRQVGLVAEVPIEAFVEGEVRGHEDVQPDRVEALVRHHASVSGRSALVALMFASDPRFEQLTAEGEVLLDFDDGLKQTVRKLTDDRDLTAYFSSRRLYITDGHHRVAAAKEEWWRDGRPKEFKVLCVIFPDNQLKALAFHRRMAGPMPDDWLSQLTRSFEIEDGDATAARGSIGLYWQGEWHRLISRHAEAPDVEVLHREVVGDAPVEYISEVTPLDETIARCDADGGALFLLAPPSCAQIMDVADRGEVMESKSTYFDPKPRSGVFVRFPGE